jgi:D-alanyl-D-alanine carboxypeptidase
MFMNRGWAALVTAGLVWCWGSAAHAADRFSPENIQKLDRIIAEEMKAENLPSVVVGVWVPGEGRYVTSMGKADLRTGRRREPTELFRIASISKTVIGTAILQLVDENKLSKGDKISKWFPDFPNAGRIRVYDLLRMRSGLADSVGQEFIEEYYENRLIALTPADMIKRGAKLEDEFQTPNEKTVYNNLNYVMLGVILEKVTGRRIDRLLADKIFRPLGMKNSSYPQLPYLYGRLHGYSLDPRTHRLVDTTLLNPAPTGGAGAIVSNLTDLHIWAKELCAGRLLKPATQEARLRTRTLGKKGAGIARYGEGVIKLGPFCGHNGTIFGFSSEMWYLPALQAVMVINVNRLDENDESRSGPLFYKLSKALFPDYVPW